MREGGVKAICLWWCFVCYALAQQPGSTYAVLIGIKNYNDNDSRRVRLQFADKDAIFLGQPLRNKSRADDYVSVLTDQEQNPLNVATQTNVLRRLERVLMKQAGPRDHVYIFISARGHATRQLADGYISALNTDSGQQNSTTIRVSELRSYVQKSSAGKIFVFADVSREERVDGYDNRINIRLEELRSLPRTEVILASEPRQVSIEDPGLKRGVFGYYLAGGLERAATLMEVFDYLKREIERQTNSRQVPYPGPRDPKLPLFPLAALPRLYDRPFAVLLAAAQTPPLPATASAYIMRLLTQLREPNNRGAVPDTVREARGRLSELDLFNVAAALEDEGQSVIVRYGAGDQFPGDPLALSRDDFERAAAAFGGAFMLRPDLPSLESRMIFCRGRALLFDPSAPQPAERDLLEAIGKDRNMARDYPESRSHEPAGPYNALGLAYLEQRRYTDAAQSFQYAIEREPGWAYPRHNLALTLVEQGDYAGAERTYRAAIERAPYYAYLYYNLGLMLQRMNRRKAAEREYLIALHRLGYRAALFAQRAATWLEDGKPEEARIASIRARELRRNRAQVWNALGTLLESEMRTEEALEAYRNALAADPDLLIAAHNTGLLYKSMGQVDDAIGVWADLVRRDGTRHLSRLKLAEAYLLKKDIGGARVEYEAVLKTQPDNFEARRGLAEVLARENNPTGAISELTRAIQDQIAQRKTETAELLASPEAHERLGDLYRLVGKGEDACGEFQRALRAATEGPYGGNRRSLKQKMKTACQNAALVRATTNPKEGR
jgi:tetratricopeptide (TPR) repeat protein